MNLYDLSHLLNNNSPVYPGSEKPAFDVAADIDVNGYRETRMTFNSHLGTHIDAPAHILENGISLDRMPPEVFTGLALVIEVPEKTEVIDRVFLEKYKNQISQADFLLFKTHQARYWGSPGYFVNYPVPDAEAASFLTGSSLKGVGFDTISADKMESIALENHHIFLEKGMIIIENLIFPLDFTLSSGRLFCFPIPFENADGSPVRAILETQQ